MARNDKRANQRQVSDSFHAWSARANCSLPFGSELSFIFVEQVLGDQGLPAVSGWCGCFLSSELWSFLVCSVSYGVDLTPSISQRGFTFR